MGFIERARQTPADLPCFGLLHDGQLVSFVQFTPQIDTIWEIGMSRPRPACRGKGLAKVLLMATRNRPNRPDLRLQRA